MGSEMCIRDSLSLDELALRLGKSERLKAVGRIDRGRLQYQVMASTLSEHPEELEDLVVAGTPEEPLRLGSVARVSISHEDRLVAVQSRGREAVGITIFRRLGGDALAISTRLAGVLEEARRSAPSGVTIHTVYDQADLVRTSLANVRDAIVVGGICSVLTLLAFLRSPRATLIAAMAIPSTLLVTFVFLRLSGDTLNLMSLGGLAIAIGLIIDDTVVVIENIARHLQEGKGSEETIDAASREISGAVIGSSLTTVLVFVPLAFIKGVVGQFFQSLCLALGTAVLVSMVISLTVIPMLSARFLAGRSLPAPGRVYRRSAELYERALREGLRRPRLSLAMAILVVVPGYFLYRSLDTGFMPNMDEGAFVLDYFMPVGTSLVETDRVMRRVEEVLRATPEVKDYIRRTGAELGLFATEPYTGDVLIGLSSGRRRSMEEVIEDLRGKIEEEFPELLVEFVPLVRDQINDLSGVEAPIEVKVFGTDYAVLREIAGRIGGILEKIHGITDLDPHVRRGNPDVIIRADSAAARHAGLTGESVETQLEAGLYGQVAFVLPEAERLTNVRVRYPDRVRFDLDALPDLPLSVPGGGVVPLRQVARVEEKRSLNEILRENQQPMISVTGEIEAALAQIELPKGYRWELAGNYESQREAFWNLGMVLAVGAGLVFLVLAIQFQSLALPFLIFLTQPLSLTCGLLALWITGTPLDVSSFMGAILLVGLDVKNGILLIEHVGQLRTRGAGLEEALIEAGRRRFRPILMTSLATILGLLPLALGIGPGSQMQQPLAIAVIGGLTANMLFTRLVIPVGYLLLERWKGEARGRPLPAGTP